MEDEKAIVKYEYLHRLDAICDLFLGVLATGATTTEELAAYLPAIMQSIPAPGFHWQ